jgi:hypothetical protein
VGIQTRVLPSAEIAMLPGPAEMVGGVEAKVVQVTPSFVEYAPSVEPLKVRTHLLGSFSAKSRLSLVPKLAVKRVEGTVVTEANWKPSMSPTATPSGTPDEGAMSASGKVSSRPLSVKDHVMGLDLMLTLL